MSEQEFPLMPAREVRLVTYPGPGRSERWLGRRLLVGGDGIRDILAR
jgi:hypothetical protein